MIPPTAGTAIRRYRAFLTSADDPRRPWVPVRRSSPRFPSNAPRYAGHRPH